jgi:hypothetical protein
VVLYHKSGQYDRSWIFSTIGFVMIAHFTFTLCRNVYLGTPEQVLWVSHVATLIGGIGACLRNRFLVSLALVTCFGHHLFWLVDTVTWLITGSFAFGATAYLKSYGLIAWIQSSNHFFLVPSLFVLAVFQGHIEKYTWIWATVLSLSLVLISLIFLPVESNINCAQKPWPGFETIILPFVGTGHLSLVRYLTYITIFTTFCNYLPTNLVLSFIIPKCSHLLCKTRLFGRLNGRLECVTK